MWHRIFLSDRPFSLHQITLIHRTLQTTTDWLTCLLVRSSRLVLGVPLWASRRVSRHPCLGPRTGSWGRRGLMSRRARRRQGDWAHNLWRSGRRSRCPHSLLRRSSTSFPWRSGCRAQSTARSGGSKRKRQGRTGRSRKGETSQRECAMDGMEMVVNWLRNWANEVWDDIKCERVRSTCTLNARCALRNCLAQHRHWCRAWWGACCACCSTCCSCCSWSHAWSHCSCCCLRFRSRVSVANFAVFGGFLFTESFLEFSEEVFQRNWKID